MRKIKRLLCALIAAGGLAVGTFAFTAAPASACTNCSDWNGASIQWYSHYTTLGYCLFDNCYEFMLPWQGASSALVDGFNVSIDEGVDFYYPGGDTTRFCIMQPFPYSDTCTTN